MILIQNSKFVYLIMEPEHAKQKLIEINGEMDKSMIRVKNFNTAH